MEDLLHPEQTAALLAEVCEERRRQDARWGEQNHPMHRSLTAAYRKYHSQEADWHKRLNDAASHAEGVTWDGVLTEELHEAKAEDDWAAARVEWVQAAAVILAMIEAQDREAAVLVSGVTAVQRGVELPEPALVDSAYDAQRRDYCSDCLCDTHQCLECGEVLCHDNKTEASSGHVHLDHTP